VDRFGRKFLLLGSASVVSISLASMGTFFYLQKQWGAEEATATLGWLPLVSLIVFFIAYSSGFANVPFIIMGELFPTTYRSILGPISSSFNLLCTFSVVRSFPAMKEGLGDDWTFWLFMITTIFSILFIFFFLPETKGKTLEEIESLFSKKSQTMQSSRMGSLRVDSTGAGMVETVKSPSNVNDNVNDENKTGKQSLSPKTFSSTDGSEDEDDNETIPVPVPT